MGHSVVNEWLQASHGYSARRAQEARAPPYTEGGCQADTCAKACARCDPDAPPRVYSACMEGTRGVHAEYTRGTRGVHAEYTRSARGVYAEYTRSTRGVYAEYTRGTRGVHAGYTRGIRGVHAEYTLHACTPRVCPRRPRRIMAYPGGDGAV
jgi:hypothetical protein